MNSKHTPGTWAFSPRLSPSENSRGFDLYREANPRRGIAVIGPIDSDGIEGEANAYLIAAAPDMYKALTDCFAFLKGYDMQGMTEGEILSNARAAITKAEGMLNE